MTFWSAATLRRRIEKEELISDYCEKRVGRANYSLRMGSQAYVSPEKRVTRVDDRQIKLLKDCLNCTIPPGQFGFLLTEETVRVPYNAIAFISVRATFKFKGLVNVSGFHVDPGWNDRLIFAVFNGGPSSVTVSRGDKLFHIWFADLDEDAEEIDPKKLKADGIGSDVINGLGDQLISMVSLTKRVDELSAAQAEISALNKTKIALMIALVAALGAIAANLYMSRGTAPSVLLDQRSDLSIADDPVIPDDIGDSNSGSTDVDPANDSPG